MSIVAVHGPNTMFTTEGGGTAVASSPAGATATKSPTNGLVFNFAFPNPGARPAADFDWSFTGPGSPAAQPDKHSGTVTFTGAGAVTIVCTVAAGAGPPAGGTYTVTAAATAGTPRSLPRSVEAPDGDGETANVEEFRQGRGSALEKNTQALEENTQAVEENTQTQETLEFDPADYTVAEIEEYVEENPEEASAVLAAERRGKGRVTLMTFLESLTDDE